MIPPNRWDNYSGLAINPDGRTLWLYNEYILTIPDQELSDVWKTFGASFTLAHHKRCNKCCNRCNKYCNRCNKCNKCNKCCNRCYNRCYNRCNNRCNKCCNRCNRCNRCCNRYNKRYNKSINILEKSDNFTFQDKIDAYDKKYKNISRKFTSTLKSQYSKYIFIKD